MSGRPGTSQLHRISALRASSVVAAGTPRAKSPPPRVSAFHPAHMLASQSLEACTKSYRAPAQAYISRPIVAQAAHIAHTSSRSRQPPTALHHTFVPTCRSDSRPSTPKLTTPMTLFRATAARSNGTKTALGTDLGHDGHLVSERGRLGGIIWISDEDWCTVHDGREVLAKEAPIVIERV